MATRWRRRLSETMDEVSFFTVIIGVNTVVGGLLGVFSTTGVWRVLSAAVMLAGVLLVAKSVQRMRRG